MENFKLGKIATQLLIENDHIRVWDLSLNPGEATDWHEHQTDYLFVVVNNGLVVTEYADGTKEFQDDPIGKVEYRMKDQIHRLVNTGDKLYRNIVVEIKPATK